MHLQTVNRDQRRERETLPRQRGEEAEETVSLLFIYLFIPSFFFSLSSCPGIVNVLLCPAFPLPPFILQSFLECFLNAKVVCFFFFFFLLPKCIAIPKHAPYPSFPHSFTLHFLIFPSPTSSHPCTYIFLCWGWEGGWVSGFIRKEVFQQASGCTLPDFHPAVCRVSLNTLQQLNPRTRRPSTHVRKDNRKTPLSSSVFLSFFLSFFFLVPLLLNIWKAKESL